MRRPQDGVEDADERAVDSLLGESLLHRLELRKIASAWTMRYGQPGEWRMVLREAAAETLHEGRRASERSDTLDHSTPLTRPPPSAVKHRRRRNARLARDLRDPHRDLVLVAPAPVLARLERVDQRVAV